MIEMALLFGYNGAILLDWCLARAAAAEVPRDKSFLASDDLEVVSHGISFTQYALYPALKRYV